MKWYVDFKCVLRGQEGRGGGTFCLVSLMIDCFPSVCAMIAY